MKLSPGYVVCVLGASRGIGAYIAYSYVKAGASGIVLAARTVAGLEETAAEIKKLNPNVEIEIVGCDITDADSVAALAQKTEKRFGRVDVAVINSGVSGPTAVKATDDDLALVKQCMDVNYVGTFYAAKFLIPLLLKSENGAKAFIGINTGACEYQSSIQSRRPKPY